MTNARSVGHLSLLGALRRRYAPSFNPKFYRPNPRTFWQSRDAPRHWLKTSRPKMLKGDHPPGQLQAMVPAPDSTRESLRSRRTVAEHRPSRVPRACRYQSTIESYLSSVRDAGATLLRQSRLASALRDRQIPQESRPQGSGQEVPWQVSRADQPHHRS